MSSKKQPSLLKQSIIELIQPQAGEEMAAYTSSKDVNAANRHSDKEDIITPKEYQGVDCFC